MSTKVIDLQNRKAVKVVKWKVDVGQVVYDGRVLLLYEGEGKVQKLKSKHVGTLTKLIAKEGDVINPGEPLLELTEGCSHPTIINELCAECGADLQRDGSSESNATVPMVHHIPQLKVSHEVAQKLGKADTERLLNDRKLVLLVDLDQTLIHTTHNNIPSNLKDVHHFQLGNSAWYHTRLRPGTARFLREMSTIYELHICTFGVRPYAHTVARILDSDGSLFSTRILSRDECLHHNSKVANLQALFPSGVELVCIIDDRQDVWNYSPNLIPVKPYCFFQSTGDINDPNLPTPFKHSDFYAEGVKVKHKEPGEVEPDVLDVEDEDDYLLYLETILKNVHKTFYDIYDKKVEGKDDEEETGKPEVSWVLNKLRGSILSECEIVFTGLVPLNTGLKQSEPYLMAKILGAKVSTDISASTTHVIAAKRNTAKMRAAKKCSTIHLVNPEWLTTCLYRWERVEEKLYHIEEESSTNNSASVNDPSQEASQDLSTAAGISLTLEDMKSMKDEVNAELPSSSDNGTAEKIESTEEGLLSVEMLEDIEPANVLESKSSMNTGSVDASKPSECGTIRKRRRIFRTMMDRLTNQCDIEDENLSADSKLPPMAARELLNRVHVPEAREPTHGRKSIISRNHSESKNQYVSESPLREKKVSWKSELTAVRNIERINRSVPDWDECPEDNNGESSDCILIRRKTADLLRIQIASAEAEEQRNRSLHALKVAHMEAEHLKKIRLLEKNWSMKQTRNLLKVDLCKMEYEARRQELELLQMHLEDRKALRLVTPQVTKCEASTNTAFSSEPPSVGTADMQSTEGQSETGVSSDNDADRVIATQNLNSAITESAGLMTQGLVTQVTAVVPSSEESGI